MTVAHAHTLPRKMIVTMEDVPLPGMPEPKTTSFLCTAKHRGFHCAMIHHPETPDQHYYVADKA